tara:strand:- start:9691 stop:10308 length:618 start_codon:yes stop_codon:yes gene_type:complete
MSWPSGSKAGTSNVDNGNDLLANARADIKQNIDNTNSIIDEFNISSPSDGDLLQYSSSTGKFEQVASGSIGAAGQQAIIKADATDLNLDSAGNRAGANLKVPLSEIFDGAGFISISNDQISLTAATYWLEFESTIDKGTGTTTIDVRNDTDDDLIATVNPKAANVDFNTNLVFTLTGTKNIEFKVTTDTNFTTSGRAFIRISKYT